MPPTNGSLGFLTLWPAGQPRPLTSTLNSLDGRIKSNAAIVPAGIGVNAGSDFVPATDPNALAFYPIAPCRIADTRKAAGPLGGPSLDASQSRTFPILSTCNVPTTARAYSLNFAAVPSGPLFLTAWPTGQARPVAASLNVGLGTGAVTATLSLYGVTPCRVVDTRKPAGSAPMTSLDVAVSASGCGIPATAQAHVMSVAVVPTAAVPPPFLGFLTLWPQGQTPRPLASTLNALDGWITSNMAIVGSTNGWISAFARDPTHMIVDISGYFGQ